MGDYPKGLVYKDGIPGRYIRTITLSLGYGDDDRMVWYPLHQTQKTPLKNTANDPIKLSTETTPFAEEKK